MTDTYEGWANRETWCANLWLSNEEGTYNLVRSMAREEIQQARYDDDGYIARGVFTVEEIARGQLADRIEAWFEECASWVYDAAKSDGTAPEGITTMIEDIGSLYRVDWHEIAGHWVEDMAQELAEN